MIIVTIGSIHLHIDLNKVCITAPNLPKDLCITREIKHQQQCEILLFQLHLQYFPNENYNRLTKWDED